MTLIDLGSSVFIHLQLHAPVGGDSAPMRCFPAVGDDRRRRTTTTEEEEVRSTSASRLVLRHRRRRSKQRQGEQLQLCGPEQLAGRRCCGRVPDKYSPYNQAAMSSVQHLRRLINERLTAAAQEIFGAFEKTIVEYEEEVARQRRLLDIAWKPVIKLHRTGL